MFSKLKNTFKILLSKDSTISFGRSISLLLIISGIIDNLIYMYCRYHFEQFRLDDNDINAMLLKFGTAVLLYVITKLGDIEFEKFEKLYNSETTRKFIDKK